MSLGEFRGRRASVIHNLVGWLVLAAALTAPGAGKAMAFVPTDRGACQVRTCIIATGLIGERSAEDFAALLKRERIAPGALVVLDSDGGDVISALKLGGIIRRASLATTVAAFDNATGSLKPATCASACAYVLLGGVERSVEKGGRIGVHQLYAPSGGVLTAEDAQWVASLVAVHVEKMGGSLGLLSTAMRTPAHSMHWLSPREQASFQVTTLSDGQVYRTAGRTPAEREASLTSAIRAAGRTAVLSRSN